MCSRVLLPLVLALPGCGGGADEPQDICIEACSAHECGIADDCHCGNCWTGFACEDNQCVCQPYCGSRKCGGDGCGGSCGTCPDDETCTSRGKCHVETPDGPCQVGESGGFNWVLVEDCWWENETLENCDSNPGADIDSIVLYRADQLVACVEQVEYHPADPPPPLKTGHAIRWPVLRVGASGPSPGEPHAGNRMCKRTSPGLRLVAGSHCALAKPQFSSVGRLWRSWSVSVIGQGSIEVHPERSRLAGKSKGW